MRNSWSTILYVCILFILPASASMKPDLNHEEGSTTIALSVHDNNTVFNTLTITYSDFGHEHVSYGPDEAFAASVGVYFLLLADGASKELVTVYKGVHQRHAAPLSWKNYAITLIEATENQRKIVLKVVKVKEIPHD